MLDGQVDRYTDTSWPNSLWLWLCGLNLFYTDEVSVTERNPLMRLKAFLKTVATVQGERCSVLLGNMALIPVVVA